MAFYYCTCLKNAPRKNDAKLGRSPYREVTANSEGICVDCGYYAIACHIKAKGNLYNIITGFKDNITNARKDINSKERKYNDNRAKNSNGDLDAW